MRERLLRGSDRLLQIAVFLPGQREYVEHGGVGAVSQLGCFLCQV